MQSGMLLIWPQLHQLSCLLDRFLRNPAWAWWLVRDVRKRHPFCLVCLLGQNSPQSSSTSTLEGATLGSQWKANPRPTSVVSNMS